MSNSHALWPIRVGERLRRQLLHRLVGGSHQWGITSCLSKSAILVFSNPLKSKKFGYDCWEGRRVNGAYHYTGQGPNGDQAVSSGANNLLLRSKALGLPVHLFESEGVEVTYVGRYQLAEDPYRWEVAPDSNGMTRKVVVFHLVQVQIDCG